MPIASNSDSGRSSTAEMPPARTWLARMANVILLLLTALAVNSIAITLRDFNQGMKSARALKLELTGVEIKSENPPDIAVTMRITNAASQDMRIDRVHFSLYLNGEFMGSNYEGWQPLTATGGMDQEFVFKIELEPFYQRRLDDARSSDEYAWSVQGEADVVLPYREKQIVLRIAQSWRKE